MDDQFPYLRPLDEHEVDTGEIEHPWWINHGLLIAFIAAVVICKVVLWVVG